MRIFVGTLLVIICVLVLWFRPENVFVVGDNYGRAWATGSATEITAADGLPILKGGNRTMAKGVTNSFYVEGAVTLINPTSCHYLAIGPKGLFAISSSPDGTHNTITPKSGKREMAVVTSVADTCPATDSGGVDDDDTEDSEEY